MVRLLAYSLFTDSDNVLEFTRGLFATEDPDLWRKDLTDAIVQWIETGLPDERRILKACGKSDEVIVLAYGRNAGLWWQSIQNKVARADKLRVYILDADETLALAGLAVKRSPRGLMTCAPSCSTSLASGISPVITRSPADMCSTM